MRHLVVFLALLPAILLLGYVLLSPAYLGDYRWVIVALPVALAVARELHDHANSGRADSSRQVIQVTLEPLDEFLRPEDDEQADADSIDGLWTGTVRIWPGKPDEALQVLPLQIVITDAGRTASAITPAYRLSDTRIVEAQIIEYQPHNGHLDMKLVIEEKGSRRDLEATLTLAHRKFVPR